MPKGKQRSPDRILADLEAEKAAELAKWKKRIEDIDKQIKDTRPKVTAARKREIEAEQFAVGRLALSLLASDTMIKRRLVEAAGLLGEKDRDRVALARVLGPIPDQPLPELAPVRPVGEDLDKVTANATERGNSLRRPRKMAEAISRSEVASHSEPDGPA